MAVTLNNNCKVNGSETLPTAAAGQPPVNLNHSLSVNTGTTSFNTVWSQAMTGVSPTPTVLTMNALTYPNYSVPRDLATLQYLSLVSIKNTGSETLTVDFKAAGDVSIPNALQELAPGAGCYLYSVTVDVFGQAVVTVELSVAANTTDCELIFGSQLT